MHCSETLRLYHRKLWSSLLVIPMMGLPVGSYAAEKTSLSSSAAAIPAFITADKLNYDQATSEVTATGHVEILQGDRIVLADKIIYNKDKNTVKAIGHVSMLEPTGDVFFADEMDVKDDMKTSVVKQFKARLIDDSLLAANTATRTVGKTKLEKVVYSPCPVCEGRDPQWQIKAGSVTIDEEKQKVSYKNAFFEAYGVPVFYTPYFSHSTPNADRKTGFLTPTYSNITSLGSTIKMPYYINIAPHMDATVTPYLTSLEGPVLIGNFRHLTQKGKYEFTGSITNPDDYRVHSDGRSRGKQIRGHIEGKGDFSLKDDWNTGFDIKRASDDTYLRRYRFGEEDYLTSRVYTERLEKRDYLTIQGVMFQDLQLNTQATTPVVAPLVDYHIETDPGKLNSRFMLDANTAILSREEGADSRHASATGSWLLPYITQSGHVLGLTTRLRGDQYSVNNVPITLTQGHSDNFSGNVSRIVPEAQLDWRFPLINRFSKMNMLIEPIANVILSSNGHNPQKIPNEDSRYIELSDANLFSSNRFSGYDRIENGPRANYGLRSSIYGHNGGNINMLFGQNYRLKEDVNLKKGSGMDDNFSDYVGKIGLNPNEKLDLAYRFRLDKEDFSVHRNEITTSVNLAPVNLSLSYISLNEDVFGNNPDRKEIYGAISTELSKKWTIKADGRKNLEKDGGLIATGASLLYHGDCLDVHTSVIKQYTTDRDIKPSTAVTFQVFLKNLNKPPR